MVNPKALRASLKWSQEKMADFLGCDQATVYRIEHGQPPSGAMRRLLDRLHHLVDSGHLLPDVPVVDALRITIGRIPSAVSPFQPLEPQSA